MEMIKYRRQKDLEIKPITAYVNCEFNFSGLICVQQVPDEEQREEKTESILDVNSFI